MSQFESISFTNQHLNKELLNIYTFLIINKNVTLQKLIINAKKNGYNIKYSEKEQQFIIKTKEYSFAINYNYDLMDFLFNKENNNILSTPLGEEASTVEDQPTIEEKPSTVKEKPTIKEEPSTIEEQPTTVETTVEDISHVEEIYDGTRVIVSFNNGKMMCRTSGSFNNCEYLNNKLNRYESSKYDNNKSIYDLFIEQCRDTKINFDKLIKLSEKDKDKIYVLNFILILKNTPIPKGDDFKQTIILEKVYTIKHTKHHNSFLKLLIEREKLNTLDIFTKDFEIKKNECKLKMLNFINNNNLFEIYQLDINKFSEYLRLENICDIKNPTSFEYKDYDDINIKLNQLPYYVKGYRIIYKDYSYKDIINIKYNEIIELRIENSICCNKSDDINFTEMKDIKNIWRLFQKLVCEGKLQLFYEYYDKNENYKKIFIYFMDKIDDFISKLFKLYDYGNIYKKINNSNRIIKNTIKIPFPFHIKHIIMEQYDPNKKYNQIVKDLLDYTHQEYKKLKTQTSVFQVQFDEEYLKTNMIFNNFFVCDYNNWKTNNIENRKKYLFFGDLYAKIITPIWNK